MATLEGIDVSNWQGSVSWRDVHAAGKSFGFAKATEGTGYRDPTFPHNWQAMRSQGMVRGAYHFCRLDQDAVQQADALHAFVRDSGHFRYGDCAIADFEELGDRTPVQAIRWLVDFTSRCKQQIAKQVIIYTDPDIWINHLGNPAVDELADYPLWLADLGSYIPTLNTWPRGLSFWQYSWSGHVPGVAGQCDLDRYYGDWRSLLRLMRPPWAV